MESYHIQHNVTSWGTSWCLNWNGTISNQISDSLILLNQIFSFTAKLRICVTVYFTHAKCTSHLVRKWEWISKKEKTYSSVWLQRVISSGSSRHLGLQLAFMYIWGSSGHSSDLRAWKPFKMHSFHQTVTLNSTVPFQCVFWLLILALHQEGVTWPNESAGLRGEGLPLKKPLQWVAKHPASLNCHCQIPCINTLCFWSSGSQTWCWSSKALLIFHLSLLYKHLAKTNQVCFANRDPTLAGRAGREEYAVLWLLRTTIENHCCALW